MHPLPSYFCNYFKRRKLISHLGNKEGSWLLSWITRINMNSDTQMPEECNNANAAWKQEMAALLARCGWVRLRWCDRGQSCPRGGTCLGDRKAGWNLAAASDKCRKKPQQNHEQQRWATRPACTAVFSLMWSHLKHRLQFHLISRNITRGFTKDQKTGKEVKSHDLIRKMFEKNTQTWNCYW